MRAICDESCLTGLKILAKINGMRHGGKESSFSCCSHYTERTDGLSLFSKLVVTTAY